MTTVNIRKQGGAAIITIPSHILKSLKIDIGTTLELDIADNSFTAHPIHKSTRRRYTLAELLEGVTPTMMKALNEETQWAREGDATGNEIT